VCPVVTATPAQTSVTLNWSADTNATLGYRVIWYSGTVQNNTVIQDNTVNHGGLYTETKTGLTPNTQYYFKVSPLDPNGGTDNFGDPLTINCSMHPVTTTT
jgi:hypothetical protein